MTEIHATFFNFSEVALLSQILPKSSDYEFTADKIFRRREPPACTCGNKCVHNGYDYVRKKQFGKVKIGKCICPVCGRQLNEDKGFWKAILGKWQETITDLIKVLRNSHTAYRVIASIMEFIVPCGKDRIYNLFNQAMDSYKYSVNDSFIIVHYDEQHPKHGRSQKFRLTLLGVNGKVIADELYDNKVKETIKGFLLKHLDPNKELVIITDCDNGYPALLKEIWGNRIRQQKCLLHLNKLICKDFGKNTNLLVEYNKYLMLDIFYDRSSELKKLEQLIKEFGEQKFANNKEKWEWICKTKEKFWDYLKKGENRRRRKKKNLKQRSLQEAEEKLAKIVFQKNLFPKKLWKRIDMIKENWDYFTTFYHVAGCPATNNIIENFYSTSLKTHRKKQFRTDRGLENQMKLAALKREGNFEKPNETLFGIFLKIRLLVT